MQIPDDRDIAIKPVFRIQIAKMIYGGSGLGFYEGRAVMIPYSLPGEELTVRVCIEKKDYVIAEIDDIITPSPGRIRPDCPNFTRCGGCDYLHASYDAEIAFKHDIVFDCLVRIGRFLKEDIPPVSIITGDRYYYRSHARLQCDHAGKTGFFERSSNTVVPFSPEGCLLLDSRIASHTVGLNTDLPREIKLAVDNSGYCIDSDHKEQRVRNIENALIFDRTLDCFFQANRFLRHDLLARVHEFADLGSTQFFIDLGCGIGFFGMSLARQGARGIGVDSNSVSIAWARHNARVNNISTVEWIASDMSRIPRRHKPVDVVIADPPRSGMSSNTRRSIIALGSKKIIAVSCNPATFSRDAACFRDAGYRLSKITMIDMFPATRHIEIAALMEKNGKK